MYLPKHFAGDEAVGREVMQAHSWALLMTTDEAGAPFATHLALLWQDDGSEHGSLIGHMARANPHWKLFERPAESLALFWGPHAYVSPTWYAPGPKVPTWNYVTVHAYGRPQVIEDDAGRARRADQAFDGLRGRGPVVVEPRPPAAGQCRGPDARHRRLPDAARADRRPRSSSARTATSRIARASSRSWRRATTRTRRRRPTG